MRVAKKYEEVIRPQPPVFRQIAAFVFGLIFAFTNGYSGLQLLCVIICAPLLFGGAIRLYTGMYRLAISLFHVSLIAIVAGFSGVAAVTSFVLMPAFQKSTALGVAVTVVLMVCEAVVFIKDVRILKYNSEIN